MASSGRGSCRTIAILGEGDCCASTGRGAYWKSKDGATCFWTSDFRVPGTRTCTKAIVSKSCEICVKGRVDEDGHYFQKSRGSLRKVLKLEVQLMTKSRGVSDLAAFQNLLALPHFNPYSKVNLPNDKSQRYHSRLKYK